MWLVPAREEVYSDAEVWETAMTTGVPVEDRKVPTPQFEFVAEDEQVKSENPLCKTRELLLIYRL